MGAEQQLIDNLVKNITTNKYYHNSVNSQTYPDLVFEHNNEFFILECKVNNAFNEANYAKQILAEIMKNRKDINNCSSISFGTKPINYGFLVDYDNQNKTELINKLQNYYTKEDWDAFGKMYQCKYIFLYDSINSVLYYCDWAYDKFITPSTYQIWE